MGGVEGADPGPEPPADGIDAGAVLRTLGTPAVAFDRSGTIRYASPALSGWVRSVRQLGRRDGAETTEWTGKTEDDWTALLRDLFGDPGEPGGAPDPADDSDGAGLTWSVRLPVPGRPRIVFERESCTIHGADRTIVGRLETLTDVSSQVQWEEEIERERERHARELSVLRARLEKVEKFERELTQNVTHDLKTPIASIKASVSGLLAGDVEYDAAELRETLSVIQEEAERLLRRVNNLLAMARMESGDALISRDWVDIADVVAAAVESLKSIQGAHPVRLDLPEDLPLVLADYDQIRTALGNLLENAFLYSPAEAAVEVSVRTSLGQMRVRVRDHGPGLMPDEFERIFDKFYRGRASRRIPGTGLGLPICRGIAQAHGGNLWAEDAPGGGTVFVLSIPIDASRPDLDTEGHGEERINTDNRD